VGREARRPRWARRLVPLAVMLAACWLFPRGDGDTRLGLAHQEFGTTRAPAHIGTGTARATHDGKPSSDSTVTLPRSAARPARGATPLETYLASSVYPPTSRPIARGDRSLVDFDARHERPQRVPGLGEREVLFTADRAWLVDEEARLVVVVASFIDGGSEAPRHATVSLSAGGTSEIVLTRLSSMDAASAARATRLIHRGGREVGDLLVAVLEPAKLGLVEPTTLRLDAEILVGDTTVKRHLLVPYTPATAVPARFVGATTDSLVDGAVVLEVGVDVREPGRYLIDANLHAADGEPLAWTRFKGDLARGTTRVALRFFGKALRDRGVAGPYFLGELRGALYREGVEPNLASMPPSLEPYRTREYALDELSDAPWDSAKKQATIAKLTALEAMPGAPFVEAASP